MIYLDRESCGGSTSSKNLQYRRGPVAKVACLVRENPTGVFTRIVSIEKGLVQTIKQRHVNCLPAYETSGLQYFLLMTVECLGNISQRHPDHNYKVLLHEESLYLNPVE